MIGRHAVTVRTVPNAAAVDVSCLIDTLTIHHGRSDAQSQPDASSATLDLSIDTDVETYPPELDVGSILTVTTTLAGQVVTRFVGRITDLDHSWNDEGENTPNASEARVIATSILADLGRRVVGDVPWGQELDGSRVSRIMTAAGITLDPLYSDPGTVQILPRDVDSQPALDLAQSVADSAGGLVWETRDGTIRYADANHRRGATSHLELDACDVLVTPTWSRDTEGLINRVSIGYGVPSTQGGDQPRYVAQRDDSIASFGRYEVSTSTELAALADATAYGQLLLTRNYKPVWSLSALPVDVGGLDATRTLALLNLDLNDLVNVTGLPLAGTSPTTALLWVEGWDETLAWGVHDLTLVVSDYCRTSPPPRWDDMDPSRTWDSMGSITWDTATCLGPFPNLGRWNDTPASVRWNSVPASVTWDGWNSWTPTRDAPLSSPAAA